MKKFWIVFLLLVVVVAGGLGLLWRATNRGASAPRVAGGVLVWRVDGDYPEVRSETFAALARRGDHPLMRDIVFALERAARDERITGLFIDLRQLDTDWAKVEELRDQVLAFRAAGKPVLAVLAAAGTKEYALATAADRIALAPEGALLVFGVSAELSFFRDTLAKVGIAADFVHVGRFKSAPEQLTRSTASPANREMTAAIVNDRYERLVAQVATGRQVAPATARAWIDSGLFDAPTALAAGLVDTLARPRELREGFLPQDELTELADYARERVHGRTAGALALVHVAGTIMPGKSRDDNWQGRVAGAETICDRIEQAAEDDGVAAIVLRVDSPGGSAMASDEIWQAVAWAQASKPVVVSMSGYAASGGYYVSCGADSIFALPGTLTGSIGVFAGKMDLSGLYAKLGVHHEVIARGENAGFFSDLGHFTPGQRQRFQVQLDAFYARFVAKVADGRGLEPIAVDAVAQGRVWSGDQALARGLVDGEGGLIRALRSAKTLAGIPVDEKVRVLTYERRLGWLERLALEALHGMPLLNAQGGAAELLPAPMAAWRRELARSGTLALAELLDGQTVALPPFTLRVH